MRRRRAHGLPFECNIKELRIPFVAAWEHERPRIGEDKNIGADAVFSGVVDHRAEALAGNLGKPILGQMAPQRQRACMAFDICQVCGRDILGGRILLGDIGPMGKGDLIAADEPPCCAICALIAIKMCPRAAKTWTERGGLIVYERELFYQVVEMRKGDDYKKSFRGAEGLDRATFRRWMHKPLVMHVRLVPTEGVAIHSEADLKELAAEEADNHARSRVDAGALIW
jgi:hypothetical protein